jgi:hypothetical protein
MKKSRAAALERLEVALELVAELARGEHHAGEEGAERRREPDARHEQRDADDEEERRGGEHLAQPRARDGAEGGAHRPPAAEHHGGHRAEHGERLQPAGEPAHPRRRPPAPRRRPPRPRRERGEQREEREHRDDGDVLEEQHGERALPRRRAELPLLGERLQHDRRGRQGERHPHGERRLPAQPGQRGERGERRGGERHLQPAEAEDGPTQPPEAPGLELEADDEEHHHDAELGDVQHAGALGGGAEEAEPRRADDDAGDEIAEHRAEPEASGEGHGAHGGREVDECLLEEAGARAVGRRGEEQRGAHEAAGSAPSGAPWSMSSNTAFIDSAARSASVPTRPSARAASSAP